MPKQYDFRYVAGLEERLTLENKRIEKVITENANLRECLASLMYWMDRARSGADINLDRFNECWRKCEDALVTKEEE